MSLQPPARRRGFTLPELVMTIVIIGIITAVSAPRFVSWKGFASRGSYDEAQAVVRFAQKTAVAWRRSIMVCVSATEISAISSNDCAAPTPVFLTHPTTGADLKSTATAGVTLSSSAGPSFSFDGLGRPNAAVTITLTSTIADDPARQIVVESETGYVHRN
jgi:MSHA pilin protein MshC